MFDSECQARLIESLASCATGKSMEHLQKSLFSGRILTLSLHKVANFSIQRLINHCEDKNAFENWFESELDSGLDKILGSGHTGVVLSVAKACRRLNTKQAHFLVVRSISYFFKTLLLNKFCF